MRGGQAEAETMASGAIFVRYNWRLAAGEIEALAIDDDPALVFTRRRSSTRTGRRFPTEHAANCGCAVVGVPDEPWGEVGRAYEIAVPGLSISAEEIVAHCSARLAKFKVPASAVVTDEIPRTA